MKLLKGNSLQRPFWFAYILYPKLPKLVIKLDSKVLYLLVQARGLTKGNSLEGPFWLAYILDSKLAKLVIKLDSKVSYLLLQSSGSWGQLWDDDVGLWDVFVKHHSVGQSKGQRVVSLSLNSLVDIFFAKLALTWNKTKKTFNSLHALAKKI